MQIEFATPLERRMNAERKARIARMGGNTTFVDPRAEPAVVEHDPTICVCAPRPPSPPLTERQVLERLLASAAAPKWRKVLAATCLHFGAEFSMSDLQGRSRKGPIIYVRFIAIYIMKTSHHLTLVEVGRRFFRDHTTVLHAIRKIKRMIAGGREDTCADIAAIQAILSAAIIEKSQQN